MSKYIIKIEADSGGVFATLSRDGVYLVTSFGDNEVDAIAEVKSKARLFEANEKENRIIELDSLN